MEAKRTFCVLSNLKDMLPSDLLRLAMNLGLSLWDLVVIGFSLFIKVFAVVDCFVVEAHIMSKLLVVDMPNYLL